ADVYNSDLANTFGNSASRVTNMINKYFDGVCPEAAVKVQTTQNYSHSAEEILAKYTKAGNQLDLSATADAALSLVRMVDSYIEETSPFKLAKDEEKLPEVATILYNCIEALRIASVMLWPFIPDQCEVFWERIGLSNYTKTLAEGGGQLKAWSQWGQMQHGSQVQKGNPLFPRYQVK
ncbi:MAG: methionine--tRNA ligase, partial [Phycisphaeraceae bacterium JB051]